MEKTLEQQASNCIKIVLFGPESSGKTTLAKALAKHYQTSWVPEYMRTFLETVNRPIEKADLLPIAQGQMESENRLATTANSYLFCDTNLRELKVYSLYYYDSFCFAEILEAIKTHHYHHYFLTDIDIPWVADPLRDRPHDRQNMFRIFETELIQHQQPYTVLSGNLQERLNKATQVLNSLKFN